ncbi:MAG: 3-hydroxyacyl-CoA dehydrogenase family protein [Trueperaceae bacterium]|nr:MAG: 3-hydroxyacyl-CoA dehydrogenase family protein [Trueperaceae bacterium]
MDVIEKVAVVGAGVMGSGIATLCLASGFRVSVYDSYGGALERTEARARKRTEPERVERDLDLTTDLSSAVRDADFVIEAIPENLQLKRDMFAQIDRHASAKAVLATNTSELSVTAIAAATERPAQVIGMHWFNPPERMALIEIVVALQTDERTLERTRDLAERCGKTPVVVQDRQGFVTTRALAALLCESIRILEEGVASRDDIDAAIRLGLNHPMGPLELADYVGLDTLLYISEAMTEAIGERFRPSQTLRKLVEAGHLGRKSGQGFYHYGDKE